VVVVVVVVLAAAGAILSVVKLLECSNINLLH